MFAMGCNTGKYVFDFEIKFLGVTLTTHKPEILLPLLELQGYTVRLAHM